MTVAVSPSIPVANWIPILTDGQRSFYEAWETINEIVEAIAHGRGHSPDEEAILWTYLDLSGAGDTLETESLPTYTSETETVNHLGLHGGLCGSAWIAHHLACLNGIGRDEPASVPTDPLEGIDRMVVAQLRILSWNGNWGIRTGLSGIGIYLLDRLPRPDAVSGIQLIIELLDQFAERTDSGITWRTPPDGLPERERGLMPSGCHSLGIQDGIAGIIYFLSEVCNAGLDDGRAKGLLEGALKWLVQQQCQAGSLSIFGPIVCDGAFETVPRLAWCQGDLSILAVVSQLGLESDELKLVGRVLLDHCLAWPSDMSGVVEPSLCHGAAGVAHVFNRIYHATGDPRSLEAALAWFEWTVAMCKSGPGHAVLPDVETQGARAGPTAHSEFLDGEIGIALSLLGAVSTVEPHWDRRMALSCKRQQTEARMRR